MKENKTICRKEEFIDEVFGEKVEYVRIYEDKEITIIFGMDNQIIVKKFKNTKELIEKFIEKFIECEFSDRMWKEQEEEMEILQDKNKFLIECLKGTLKDLDSKSQVLCNKCKGMEE